MKPIFEKLTQFPDEGFTLKEIRGPECDCPWHFHAEFELILVLQSRGYRIIGDKVTSLEPGDLVLIGGNLPHVYQPHDPVLSVEDEEKGAATSCAKHPKGRSGKRCLSPLPPQAHCILIQFEDRCWSGLLQLPALAGVRGLLRRAALGLQVTGRTRDAVAAVMTRMPGLRGVQRITTLLTILDSLARSRSCRPIASPGFAGVHDPFDEQRVNRVCQFINDQLHRPIRLAEAARLVHLSEGAFSRFFRAHLGKTFPALVNELRIGRACRLLAETQRSVTEVALACGYTNLSNFTRQFLRLKKVTPRRFRERVAAAERKRGV